MSRSALVRRAFELFAADTSAAPMLTLRGGNQVDDCEKPSSFDPTTDSVSDKYLESYFWGVAHLDASSWRHYLPHLIEYGSRHSRDGGHVVEALLNSLRPPDRSPPRLASLTFEQEDRIREFLESLAFEEGSAHQSLACQALEEWWFPNPLYRAAAK